MRIAFAVSDFTYPPREGLHQQTILLISELCRRGVDVNLLGFVKDPESIDGDALFRHHGIKMPRELIQAGNSGLMTGYLSLWQRRLGRLRPQPLVGASLASYDAIHLDGAAACGLASADIASSSVVSLVDPGSRRFARLARASTTGQAKLGAYAKSLAHLIFESQLARLRPTFHFVSGSDSAYMQRLHPHSRVATIPIMLPPRLERMDPVAPSGPVREVLIYADMRQSHARQDVIRLLEDVLRPNAAAFRAVRFTVLGRVREDSQLARAAAGLSVQFIHWADDYVDTIARSDLVILPDTVGTGLKNRTIQSLSMGMPVLGTSTAFEGIDCVDGEHALLADTRDLMLSKLLEVCHKGTPPGIGQRARDFAVTNYSASVITDRWIALYERLGQG